MEFNRHELLHFLKNPIRLRNIVKKAKNLANENNYMAIKNKLKEKLDCEIFFFGSRLMKMSHRQSDLDMFVSIGESRMKIYWMLLMITSTIFNCMP